MQGIGGYPAGQSTIQVLVNEPTTLTATYRTEPDLVLVGLLLLLMAALVLGVLEYRQGWVSERMPRVRGWTQHLGGPFRQRGEPPVEPAPRQTTDAEPQTDYRNGTPVSRPASSQQR